MQLYTTKAVATRAVKASLEKAGKCGRWLVVVAREDAGQVYVDVRTWAFSENDLPVTLDLIEADFAKRAAVKPVFARKVQEGPEKADKTKKGRASAGKTRKAAQAAGNDG